MEMKLVTQFKGKIVEIVTDVVMAETALTARGYIVAEDEFAVYVGRNNTSAAIGVPRKNIVLIAIQDEIPNPEEDLEEVPPGDVN